MSGGNARLGLRDWASAASSGDAVADLQNGVLERASRISGPWAGNAEERQVVGATA